MSERTTNLLKTVAVIVAFLLGVFLVFTGRLTYGWNGLFIMLFGIAILLTLLYLYNRRYR